MSDFFREIYQRRADDYDVLVSVEDYRGNILAALQELAVFDGATIVECGAGTGRLTRLLSLIAARVHAFDHAAPMLAVGLQRMQETGMVNWSLAAADNRALPLPADCADVAVEGWSFGHAVGWYPERWQAEVSAMLAEMRRVLRPGGMAILFETLGTGQRRPAPPTPGLAELYAWLEHEQGFSHRWLRTDYQFESVEQAERLTRFFFGDDLADNVAAQQQIVLPECTGLWWRVY